MLNFNSTDASVIEEQFHEAAFIGNVERVNAFLMSPQLNVNAADEEFGHTALHYACMKGNYAVVDILVNTEGVKIDAVDKDNNNALHHAALSGFPAIVALLLSKDAIKNKINDQNKAGKTALFCACHNQLPQFHSVIQLLLATDGINVAIPALDGSTPLHAASYLGNTEAVRLILEVDCLSVNASRKDGYRAVDLALGKSKFDTVALLKQYGATFSLTFPQAQLNRIRNDRPADERNIEPARRLHLKFLR